MNIDLKPKDAVVLSAHAQLIMKHLSKTAGANETFQAIRRSMFNIDSVEKFYAALNELKGLGMVSLKEDYQYKPYENFGDITPKQYDKIDILLKLTV